MKYREAANNINSIILISFLQMIFFGITLSQNIDKLKIIINQKKDSPVYIKYQSIDDTSIIINLYNSKNEPISNLTKEDINILKNKKKANIISILPLKEEEKIRMRLSLIIDNSSSMIEYTNQVINILDTLVANIGKGIKISVIIFDDKFKNEKYKFKDKPLNVCVLPFTKDDTLIRNYYRIGFKELSSATYLYDEIFSSINSFKIDSTKVERDIAIVLSDGADIGSKSSRKEILSMVDPSITFFTIDFVHSLSGKIKRNQFLVDLAEKTGGEYYNPSDISTLSNFFKQITIRIVEKGYKVIYKFSSTIPKINYKILPQNLANRNSRLMDFPGLVVEEIITKESFPLLNYIFFDSGKDNILSRYVLFSDRSFTEYFSEDRILGGALSHYYAILNIIGIRYKKYPGSIITLVGCSDGKEKNGILLAQKRADAVRKYLEQIWAIPSEKIKTLARILPEKPSSNLITEGDAENRRVEILCDDWRIIKPVTFKEKNLDYTPKNVNFIISMDNTSDTKIEEWELNLYRNGKLWKKISNSNPNELEFTYDWKNTFGQIPKDDYQYDYILKVIDNGGDTSYTEMKSIPVKQLKLEQTKIKQSSERKIEKVSLVLFDFGKAELGSKNDSIIQEFVYPRLYDSVYVDIQGFTDIIGSSERNLKLSTDRAKAVHDKLKEKLPGKHIFYQGYGASRPIFDNILPECRFYNRTVQLYLQNFIP